MNTAKTARSMVLVAAVLSLILIPGVASSTSFGLFGTKGVAGQSRDWGNFVVEADPGDHIYLQIICEIPEGDSVRWFQFSMVFDTDWMDELNIVDVGEAASYPDPLHPETPGIGGLIESSAYTMGYIIEWEGNSAPYEGPWGPVEFLVGTIQFEVTANVATDGVDGYLGFFAAGDEVVDNSYQHPYVSFGTLTVNTPQASPVRTTTWGRVKALYR